MFHNINSIYFILPKQYIFSAIDPISILNCKRLFTVEIQITFCCKCITDVYYTIQTTNTRARQNDAIGVGDRSGVTITNLTSKSIIFSIINNHSGIVKIKFHLTDLVTQIIVKFEDNLFTSCWSIATAPNHVPFS